MAANDPTDTDDIRGRLLVVFGQEFADHAQAVRAAVAAARAEARALTVDEAREVFRRIHSLKGAARAVDLSLIEEVMHRAEAVLTRHPAAELSPEQSTALYTLLERTIDTAEALQILADGTDDTADAARAEAQSLLRDLERAAGGRLPGRSRRAAPPTPSAPAPTTPSPSPQAPTPEPPRPASGGSSGTGADETVRISTRHLDQLLTLARQFLLEAEGQRHVPEELRRIADALPSSLGAAGDGAGSADATSPGEARNRVRALARAQEGRAWRLGRLVQRLHDEVRAARTVTAAEAVQGLETMVSQLAAQTGKAVTLTVEGEQVSLDRQIAQTIRDPLIHILRNSVSHGIEPPNERTERGKPATGTVALRFRVRGLRLEVDIEDDGRGIDLAALRQRGVAAGLLTPEEATTATDERVANLVFEPGISTARTADRLSGRGIGMSIVAHAVARLGGELRVIPRPAETAAGTLFRLSLPLSLSTQRLLLVEAGGQTFGIPTFAVERLLRVEEDQFRRVGGVEVLPLERGRPLPVMALGALLGLAPAVEDAGSAAPAGRRRMVVEVSLGGSRWGLSVDDIREEREVVVRPPGPYLNWARTVSGSVVLEDGRVALALLPGVLASRLRAAPGRGRPAPARARAERRSRPGAERRRQQRTILVADDSVTTRTLEQSILEAHGYRVLLATDGAQALATLREGMGMPERRVDLVVSDVEMPRMTGFELLAAIKEDARLAAIPVILVTSREAYEDRERGLSLGADAYIVKRKFDQSELLQAIEQLIV